MNRTVKNQVQALRRQYVMVQVAFLKFIMLFAVIISFYLERQPMDKMYNTHILIKASASVFMDYT